MWNERNLILSFLDLGIGKGSRSPLRLLGVRNTKFWVSGNITTIARLALRPPTGLCEHSKWHCLLWLGSPYHPPLVFTSDWTYHHGFPRVIYDPIWSLGWVKSIYKQITRTSYIVHVRGVIENPKLNHVLIPNLMQDYVNHFYMTRLNQTF